jgi:hypothetical protein
MLCVVFWVFCVSMVINFLNSAEKGSEIWFNKLWSLLFAPIYFNYKINKMIEETNVPTPKMILRQAQNNNLLQLTLTPNGLLAVRAKFLSRSLSIFVSQNRNRPIASYAVACLLWSWVVELPNLSGIPSGDFASKP